MTRLVLAGLAMGMALATWTAVHAQGATVHDRAAAAKAVVVAGVADVVPGWLGDEYGDLLIVSMVHLVVTEHVKAPAELVDLWVPMEGGSLNGVTLQTSSTQVPAVGARAIFLLDPGLGGYRLHRKGQGIVPLTPQALDEVRAAAAGR